MKHRFLLHELNHRMLMIDISGIQMEATAEQGNVPYSRMSRDMAMNRLRTLGASDEEVERVRRSLARTGTAVATVI